MPSRNNENRSCSRMCFVSRRRALSAIGLAGALASQSSSWGQEIDNPKTPEEETGAWHLGSLAPGKPHWEVLLFGRF